MAVLSDADLARIWPHSNPEPASINLRIGDTLRLWPTWIRRDPRINQDALWHEAPLGRVANLLGEGEPVWVLRPGYRYIATTRERIRIPDDCAGQISARSSWGRDGLDVICGPAGWIDPGFVGQVVLELSVVGSELVLWPGASICQLIVHRLETPAARPYGHPERRSKYQDQRGVTPSRTHQEVTP